MVRRLFSIVFFCFVGAGQSWGADQATRAAQEKEKLAEIAKLHYLVFTPTGYCGKNDGKPDSPYCHSYFHYANPSDSVKTKTEKITSRYGNCKMLLKKDDHSTAQDIPDTIFDTLSKTEGMLGSNDTQIVPVDVLGKAQE